MVTQYAYPVFVVAIGVVLLRTIQHTTPHYKIPLQTAKTEIRCGFKKRSFESIFRRENCDT